jgi:hypothetical protein
MLIDMNKKYTSNGRKVRILCIDRPDAVYTVVAMREDGTVSYFKKDGTSNNGKWDNYNLLEVWQPQEGEWCWFWDKDKSTYVVLDKFKGMSSYNIFQSTNCSAWKHCSKFTSELPEQLKLKIKEIK